MRNFWQRRPWLKWMMLVPMATLYGAPSCVTNAIRDVADGLNDAADSLGGKRQSSFDDFLDGLKGLF